MRWELLTPIVFLCSLASCGARAPDAQLVNGAIRESFARYIDPPGQATSPTQFTLSTVKTDGQATQVPGASGYRMFVEVTVELPGGYRPECAPGRRLCFLYSRFEPVAGPVAFTYNGSVDLSKTESGWLINAINIDFANRQQPVTRHTFTPAH